MTNVDAIKNPNCEHILKELAAKLEEQDGVALDKSLLAGIAVTLDEKIEKTYEKAMKNQLPSGQVRIKREENIYTALSNQSAVKVLEAVEKMLPNHSLSCADVFGAMLPPNCYGVTYLLNRLADQGADTVLWGDANHSLRGVTAVVPTPNLYQKPFTTRLSAIDPTQKHPPEDVAYARVHIKNPDALPMSEQGRLVAIRDREIIFGIDGNNLDAVKRIQALLSLDAVTPETTKFFGKRFWPQPFRQD